MPVNMVKKCQPLEPVTVDSWDAVGRGYIALAFQYGECGVGR
ncbi:Uncharacterized protein ChrSV_1564 [Chromobacterium vaccinii]|nr:Uncharacterized protein ChrSW_1564 [Chromobacterium vaccinii]QND89022.1 Uncharacterized protein ChrSV_1564 [Chromobacterium vaccinii]